MHLANSQNTCSMTELCGIYADSVEAFETQLKKLLDDARNGNRKMIVANIHEATAKLYGKALEAAGFVDVGRYFGNSNVFVHTYVFGLERPKVPVVKRANIAVRKIKKALAR